MADKKIEADEDGKFPHDDKFPDNVNPSKANRKAFSEQFEADRKAEQNGKQAEGERIGVGMVGEDVGTDTGVTKGTAEAATRQRKTVSK